MSPGNSGAFFLLKLLLVLEIIHTLAKLLGKECLSLAVNV